VTAGLKHLVVAVAVGLGALLAAGCLLAALFEAQGFGAPRDTDPRAGYLALLALGFVASVAVPALLWRWLLPGSAPAWWAAFAAALVGVVVILGIGFG
jgi:hypothetical protein